MRFSILHTVYSWLRHKTGSNAGTIECWHEGSTLMVGFRCDDCGKLHGVHKSKLLNSASGSGGGCTRKADSQLTEVASRPAS